MTKAKDAVITVKSIYDGDRTDRQAFIELILQRQQKLRNEPRNENNILNRKENVAATAIRRIIILLLMRYIQPDVPLWRKIL